MERSRAVFLAAAGLLTVGVPFLGGLTPRIIGEIPNLRGTGPSCAAE